MAEAVKAYPCGFRPGRLGSTISSTLVTASGGRRIERHGSARGWGRHKSATDRERGTGAPPFISKALRGQRLSAEEAADTSKIGPGGLKIEPREGQNGPGGFWGALGRQLGARRSRGALGAVFAALGPVLAPLWAVLALSARRPREPPGKSSGRLNKRPKTP